MLTYRGAAGCRIEAAIYERAPSLEDVSFGVEVRISLRVENPERAGLKYGIGLRATGERWSWRAVLCASLPLCVEPGLGIRGSGLEKKLSGSSVSLCLRGQETVAVVPDLLRPSLPTYCGTTLTPTNNRCPAPPRSTPRSGLTSL